MRGLTVFITEVRNSTSKEDEEKRVSKELAKIRKKFKEAEVDGYDRRKYICKLLYMYLLGYEIDVGYMEALSLLSSIKFQEKLIGYLSLSLLLNETHSMIPLLIQQLQNDLQSRNEYHQALALIAIGNIGGKEMAESVAPIVQKMLISKSTRIPIKKKSALCLLRLSRKYPELMSPDVWCDRLNTLLDEPDLGLLTSLLSLLLGISVSFPKPYESLVKKVIGLLAKILINREYTKDYVYYNMANPWLQVKLLRFLSYYPPCEDKQSRSKLNEILKKIINSAEVAKGQTVNHKNALNAVLFEAISLVIHLDDDRELTRQAGTLLGRFISAKETNIRYLSLDAMGRFAALDNETATIAKKHQETVILALKDPDISIRKRALDLLYGLCDKNNCKQIVSELLNYLVTADYQIREELVLKIAILAEKFATHYSWYVDVILQLIALAGDFVSDEIWYRVVQIVTNHEDIQEYASKTVLQALKQLNCHETAVKVGGYILGEFGHLIAEQPQSGPLDQFNVLHSKFPTCSLNTKALLLSTYIKFLNPYGRELTDKVREVFKQYQGSIDTELQQRACEYLKLSHASEDLIQAVWDVMPAFPDRDLNRIGNNNNNNNNNDDDISNSGNRSRVSSVNYNNNNNNNSTNNSLLDLPDANSSSTNNSTTQLAYGTTTKSTTHGKSDSTKDLEGLFGANSSFNSLPNNTNTTPGLSPSNTGISPSNSNSNVINPFAVIDNSNQNVNTIDNSAKSNGSMLTEQDIAELFRKSCMSPDGLIYQDEFIKVGFKSEYSKGFGRMMLYYLNNTNQPISGFRSFVSPLQYVQLQPVGAIIEPKGQLQQMAQFSCTTPFIDPPTIQLSFVANGKNFTFSLKLPILLARFIEPTDMNGPEFFQQWKQIAPGPPLEQQSVIRAQGAVDVVALSKTISSVFHMQILKGVDPNVNNIVATGSMVASTGQQILCLVRVESNPTAAMYRVTLRTPNAQVSQGLKDALVAVL